LKSAYGVMKNEKNNKKKKDGQKKEKKKKKEFASIHQLLCPWWEN